MVGHVLVIFNSGREGGSGKGEEKGEGRWGERGWHSYLLLHLQLLDATLAQMTPMGESLLSEGTLEYHDSPIVYIPQTWSTPLVFFSTSLQL